METCGQNCFKYLLFIFNLLFFLCGGGLLGIGIWVVVDGSSFQSIIAENPIIFNAVYVIIAVGVALLVISFLGCCGAIKENRCLLGTFFAVVLVIFIVEIVGAILAFAFYPDVRRVALNSMNRYNENSTNTVTLAWDTVQALFGCCGFSSPSNWDNSSFVPIEPNNPFPLSCCSRNTFSLSGKIVDEPSCLLENPRYFYNIGCEARFQQYFWVIGGTGIGILVVELLAMTFTCCLYRGIGDDDYK